MDWADRWLQVQPWRRDEGPCISLGEAGAFDDTHVFCPAVIEEDGRRYSGAQVLRHRHGAAGARGRLEQVAHIALEEALDQ